MKFGIMHGNNVISKDDCAAARGVWTRFDVYDSEDDAIRAANDYAAERIAELAADMPDGYVFRPETEAVMVVPVVERGDDFDLPEDYINSGAMNSAYTVPMTVDEAAFLAAIEESKKINERHTMKHNDQIAHFDGRVIVQHENSRDPGFRARVWQLIEEELEHYDYADEPDFEIDDNGFVETGTLRWNPNSGEWELKTAKWER